MSSGIVILRALRNLAVSNTVKYPSTRVVAGINQVPRRFYAEGAEKAGDGADQIDPKDRSVKVLVETSIRYMQSREYAATYGDEPVWVPYRRNFKGSKPPPKTRRSCIKLDRLVTGNPCPICRDEYLVLHEKNVALLKQFISPFTGEVLGWDTTNICRRQHDNLMVAIIRARDQGLLTSHVPFRYYDYSHYIPKELKDQDQKQQEQ